MLYLKNNHFIEINAEFSVKNFPFLSHSPPFLYINRNLALPSLCKALHNDGFGEGLEQRPITLDGNEVYISLWNCDGNYFLKPEIELFPDREIKMGGIS